MNRPIGVRSETTSNIPLLPSSIREVNPLSATEAYLEKTSFSYVGVLNRRA